MIYSVIGYSCVLLFGWFFAQVMKCIIIVIKDKRVDFSRMVGSGGMPSSHTSFTVSLATIMGITYRFDSAQFALAATLATDCYV